MWVTPSIGRQGSYGSCLGTVFQASVPPHCFPGSWWGQHGVWPVGQGLGLWFRGRSGKYRLVSAGTEWWLSTPLYVEGVDRTPNFPVFSSFSFPLSLYSRGLQNQNLPDVRTASFEQWNCQLFPKDNINTSSTDPRLCPSCHLYAGLVLPQLYKYCHLSAFPLESRKYVSSHWEFGGQADLKP